jgi:RHS repeat-associated protein
VELSTYQYDSNSNIIQVSNPSGTVFGKYDEQDRLIQFGKFAFSYNGSGDLTQKKNTETNDVTGYLYDDLGNLKSVNLSNGKIITYKVDSFGRRMLRTSNGLTDKFIYKDQLNPVRLIKSDGTIINFYYLTRQNVPDFMRIGSETYKIISDHLGSVREIRNQSGNTVQVLNYDAYGKVLSDTNPGFQPFGFSGGIYDHETGLTRFGARDYDASVGRFTSKDPILFAGGDTNLYAYVYNDPVNLIDPDGKCPLCIALAGGAFFGAAGNLIGAGLAGTLNRGNVAQIIGTGALAGAVAVGTAGTASLATATGLGAILSAPVGSGFTGVAAGLIANLGLNSLLSPPTNIPQNLPNQSQRCE